MSVHLLEFEADSFGTVLGPAGLDDLMQDIHHGYHARAAIAGINQQNAAKEWKDNAKVGLFGMRVDATFDALDFHYWLQKEGAGCWQDETFISEHKRDVDGCAVDARTGRTTILLEAGKYASVSGIKASR